MGMSLRVCLYLAAGNRGRGSGGGGGGGNGRALYKAASRQARLLRRIDNNDKDKDKDKENM
jgi:hypothetical protein